LVPTSAPGHRNIVRAIEALFWGRDGGHFRASVDLMAASMDVVPGSPSAPSRVVDRGAVVFKKRSRFELICTNAR
jgi:hypothetical protein